LKHLHDLLFLFSENEAAGKDMADVSEK